VEKIGVAASDKRRIDQQTVCGGKLFF
jgi:hypothetical protein